ncbi:MAG: tail assembly chaperone [Anaerobutyricum hallii]
MFELEMNGQVYQFNFGMGFLREINKTTTVPVKDIPGKVTNMGMQYAFAELLDGNVETLCDVLYIANKSQSPRLTKTDIDTYIDDEGTNIDALFDQVIDFLKNTNATKKETQTVLKRVTEAQEQEKQKNQEK